MAIDGTAGTLVVSQACAVFTAQPGGAGFNGLFFREKAGQGWAGPRPCLSEEKRDVQREDEPAGPTEKTGRFQVERDGSCRMSASRMRGLGIRVRGCLERTRQPGSERQLELEDAVDKVIEIPAGNRC